MTEEDPRGKCTGMAMDVIVIVPQHLSTPSTTTPNNNKYTNTGATQNNIINKNNNDDNAAAAVVGCSDFLCRFHKHTHKHTSSSSLISSLILSSIPYNPFATQTNNNISHHANNNTRVHVLLNGRRVPELEMICYTSKQNCRFKNGNALRPCSDLLRKLIHSGVLHFGRNVIRYVNVANDNRYNSNSTTDPRRVGEQQCHDNDVVVNNNLLANNNNNTDDVVCSSAAGGIDGDKYYCEAHLYVWSVMDHIVVSDIDGTVTTSDARSILDTIVTSRYNRDSCNNGYSSGNESHRKSVAHRGICDLYNYLASSLESHTIRFIYLTSRPLSLVNSTRLFISTMKQNGKVLPSGPILCRQTKSLSKSIVSEVIKKDSYEFKFDTLSRQVVIPFAAAGRQNTQDLFIAGFGNRPNDARAYEMVGLSPETIFIINSHSIIKQQSFINTHGRSSESLSNVCLNSKNNSKSNEDGGVFLSYDDALIKKAILTRLLK